MRTATPEYVRAAIGAFAFTHLGHLLEHGRKFVITTRDVDRLDPFGAFIRANARDQYMQPLRIDVQLPWGRPDPRGPGKETMRQVFGADPANPYRMSKERYPCEVGTVIPLDLTPAQLQQHALAARARLDAELARGYAIIRTASEAVRVEAGPREDPKLITERASTHTMLDRVLAEHVEPRALVVAVDVDEATYDALLYGRRSEDGLGVDVIPVVEEEVLDGELVDPYEQTDARFFGGITSETTAGPYEFMRGEPITRDPGPSFADVIAREIAKGTRRTPSPDPVPERPPYDYRSTRIRLDELLFFDRDAGASGRHSRERLTYERWRRATGYQGEARDLPAEAWADRRLMQVWADFR